MGSKSRVAVTPLPMLEPQILTNIVGKVVQCEAPFPTANEVHLVRGPIKMVSDDGNLVIVNMEYLPGEPSLEVGPHDPRAVGRPLTWVGPRREP